MALFLVTTQVLSADDTPFLQYDCAFDRAASGHQFTISFKNDDSDETETWSTSLKSTKIRFTKTSKSLVKIWIHTGAPIVAYAVPGEFEFTAPLGNEEINFTFGVRPVGMKGEFFELACHKKKAD